MADPLVESLSAYAARLKLELERVRSKEFDLRERDERVQAHRALIEHKLDLTLRLIEALTTAYSDPQFYAKAVATDLFRAAQPRPALSADLHKSPASEPAPADPERPRPEGPTPKIIDSGIANEITMAEIEATKIPTFIDGHNLFPEFRQTKVIRGAKALLLKVERATGHEILEFLAKHSIEKYDKKSLRYLTRLLSSTPGMFAISSSQSNIPQAWYLTESKEPDNDESTKPQRRPP
jgi:hypothetical protein